MIEPVTVAGRIRIQLEHRAVQSAERELVHDDRDPGRFEAMTFVRRVLLDGDPEPGAAAAEQVAHAQNGRREVGFLPEPLRGFGRDRKGAAGGRHRMPIL